MDKVKLVDYFGFMIGEPQVPKPFPKVVVWGNEFFVLNPEDFEQGVDQPRYHMTTGFVLDETKEHANYS